MGGEIKVVKNNGPGTLMRLDLHLNTPVDAKEQNHQLDPGEQNLAVILALHGNMGGFIMSQWLSKHGMSTVEASEWKELKQILDHLFYAQFLLNESLRSKVKSVREGSNPVFVIVVDIGLLDLSSNTWKEHIDFLDKFFGKAKFARMIKHDTPNAIKTRLRQKEHVLMVNKPLYKAKMIHIIEAVIKERNAKLQEQSSRECLQIDSTQFSPGYVLCVNGRTLTFCLFIRRGYLCPEPSQF